MASGIHPLLNVSDIDRTIAFYKGLGLRTKKDSMGQMTWAMVESGEGRMLFFPKDGNPDLSAEDREWLAGPIGRGVLINIGVPKAARAFEKAQALGATIDYPLSDNPWGGQGFTLVDPDGYVVHLSDRFPGNSFRREAPATRAAAKKAPAKKAAVKKAPRKAAAAKKAVKKPAKKTSSRKR
ncbi:MAG TPA: VOC family protein [Candidatus Thermoplasmatota archaeon]|nr:VOC family protein [Candidatus Thermoplasmatota archaeon]